jgi:hypothetical protein
MIDAKNFSWKKNRGVSFASDLKLPVGMIPKEFVMTNPKRNTQATFRFSGSETRDGDVLSWSFTSLCKRFTAIIFND